MAEWGAGLSPGLPAAFPSPAPSGDACRGSSLPLDRDSSRDSASASFGFPGTSLACPPRSGTPGRQRSTQGSPSPPNPALPPQQFFHPDAQRVSEMTRSASDSCQGRAALPVPPLAPPETRPETETKSDIFQGERERAEDGGVAGAGGGGGSVLTSSRTERQRRKRKGRLPPFPGQIHLAWGSEGASSEPHLGRGIPGRTGRHSRPGWECLYFQSPGPRDCGSQITPPRQPTQISSCPPTRQPRP